MSQKRITVAIPAYTIFSGGGLMHFLFQAITALSTARPAWTWRLIGTIALPELESLRSSNVRIEFWDGDTETRWLYRIGNHALRMFGKKNDAGYLIQNRAERYGLPWGKIHTRILALQGADAIWVPYYNISLNRIALSKDLHGLNIPVLLTIHDIHPAFFPNDHSSEELARFHQGFIPFARNCQRIITHSQYQKSAIIEHLQISNIKISVTPQPPLIDPASLIGTRYSEHIINIRHRFGISRPYVFYPASTTHIHKNHFRLLTAWKGLKHKLGTGCPMLVCTAKGNNQQWKHLSSLIKNYNLEKDVVFTDMVNMPTLASLYQDAILIVIPTMYEGAGSGIFTDALVSGKPVICSDIAQIHEQISAIGPLIVDFFDPFSVPAITLAVSEALEHLDELNKTAKYNQTQVKIVFTKMWETWAEYYSREIETITSS